MSSPDVVVLGLGNLLMQDEGVGVHFVKHLLAGYQFDPEIEVVDGGTSGLDLLPFFRPGAKMLMVDAMSFDQPPGSIGRVENDDILARLNTKMSVHHLGLSDLLSVMKLVDRQPDEIVLLGVQPASLELEVELSATVAAAMPKVLDYAIEQLESWGITVTSLSK